MNKLSLRLAIIAMFFFTQSQCRAKIMRNNALMNKMMSHFQKDNTLAIEPEKSEQEPQQSQQVEQRQQIEQRQPQRPRNILSVMQNVLCKNFPAIPCSVIVKDETLRKLMERSIQQITYKQLALDQTTSAPMYSFTNPVVNSEDLSNFLQVSHTGYFSKSQPNSPQSSKKKKKKSGNSKTKNYWSHEKHSKKKIKVNKDSKRAEVYTGRKKSIRKFYPHKIKYKDKNMKDFRDYSDEKMSMSVEVPDMKANRKGLPYKGENDSPVWRIDYMKHGEPSLNIFNYEDDRLRGKIMQTGPNVIVDENVLEQAARKDVLHPDVYIKKNFIRKAAVNMNSEGTD